MLAYSGVSNIDAVVKVKAHQAIATLEGVDKWKAVGNHAADHTGNEARSRHPEPAADRIRSIDLKAKELRVILAWAGDALQRWEAVPRQELANLHRAKVQGPLAPRDSSHTIGFSRATAGIAPPASRLPKSGGTRATSKAALVGTVSFSVSLRTPRATPSSSARLRGSRSSSASVAAHG